MTTACTFNINGQRHVAAVEPHDTLLDVLRDTIHLTGTKRGCDVGDCGACTVLLDGEPVNACLTLAGTIGHRTITTIEGLAKGGELTPLQRSFVEEGGIQCGFCTPGMTLAATALIERDSNPSDEDIKEALSGNMCRCTGYSGIMRSVKRCGNYRQDGTCAKRDHLDGDVPDKSPDHDTVGVSIPRVDAIDKVTGRAQYTADIFLPNMASGKLLGSPIAHGIIKRIDTSKAEALPGVLAVLTGKDVTDT